MSQSGKITLKNAFLLADAAAFASVDTAPSYSWSPSEKFEARIRSYSHGVDRYWWKFVNTAGKRVAVILLALTVLFGLSMTVDAIREPFVKLITKVLEKFTEVYVDPKTSQNMKDSMEEKYYPSYIPDGYVMTENNVYLDISIDAFYEKEDGGYEKGYISYHQDLLRSSGFLFDTEGVELIGLEIDGKLAKSYTNKGVVNLFWTDDDYMFRLSATGGLTLEDLVDIAKSLKIE